MFLTSPEVIDLGARLLFLWNAGHALRFRLAPPGELSAPPSRWLAEVSRLQEREPLLERAVNWPRLQIHARDGVALVLVEEHNAGPGASFLVRFDMLGSAFVIDVPAPPDGDLH